MIYRYLFYKYYLFTLKRKGLQRPAMGFLSMGVLFNGYTLCMLLEGLGVQSYYLNTECATVYGAAMLMALWLYYSPRKYLLLNKYEDREQTQAWTLHPIPALILYFTTSFGLMLLAGMFRNKSWIFAHL